MFRRLVTSIVVVAVLSAPSPASSAAFPGEIRSALRSRSDIAAIQELVDAYHAWLEGLRRQAEQRRATPFAGPECAGRWAIPTSIVWRESRCTYTARNPSSTAGGAYQMVRASRDWALRAAGLGQWVGTPAEHLPAWVQDRAAAALWRNSPCHWAPNPWCG